MNIFMHTYTGVRGEADVVMYSWNTVEGVEKLDSTKSLRSCSKSACVCLCAFVHACVCDLSVDPWVYFSTHEKLDACKSRWPCSERVCRSVYLCLCLCVCVCSCLRVRLTRNKMFISPENGCVFSFLKAKIILMRMEIFLLWSSCMSTNLFDRVRNV